MGFDLQHRLALQQPQTLQPIRHASHQQLIKPRRFLRVRSYNQFPAYLMRNPMPRAELHHLPRPRHTKPRLQRPRFVINAAMDHPAIVSRLMPSDPRLFFQNGNSHARELLDRLHGKRKPNNSSANHRNVISHN